MVCKVEQSRFRRQDSMNKKRSNKLQEEEVKGLKEANKQEMQVIRMQKACKFKRSCFSEEEDATASAILLLACIVCAAPSCL